MEWELRLIHEVIPKVAKFVLEFRCRVTNIQLAYLAQQIPKYFL